MSEGDTPQVEDSIDSDPQFIERIRREIEAWRSEGIITSELAETLTSRYESTEEHRRAFGLSRFSGIIAIFGVVLVGLGVIGLVAVNWSEISGSTKLGLMVAFTAVSYVVGWWLAYRSEYPRTGIAIILLGAILFGASIHLVAQSFNVEVNHPNLVTAWFIGVVPLAYVSRSKAVLVLSVILVLSALAFRSQGWWSADVGEEVFYFGIVAYMIVAAALFSLGRLHARLTRLGHFGRVFEIWAFVIAGIATYILGFLFLWTELGFEDLSMPTIEYWLTTAAAVVVSVVAIFLALRWRGSNGEISNRWRWEVSGVLVILGIAVLTLIGVLLAASWFWLLFNAVTIGAVVAMVNAGHPFQAQLSDQHRVWSFHRHRDISVFRDRYEAGAS